MRSLVFEKTLQTADLTLEEMMSSIYRLNSMAEKLFKSAVRKFSFKYDTAGPLLKRNANLISDADFQGDR